MTPAMCVGDTIRTKKPHPCGGDTWLVLRTGADIKLRCTTCRRIIMLERPDFDKRLRQHFPKEEETT